MLVVTTFPITQGEASQDPTSVSSTTTPSSLHERWRIVDRRTIETYGLRSVAEAVELVAGFTTVRTYSVRNVPTARGGLQTHYGNRVLVMIDGVPSWNATTGEGTLDRVSIEAVERLEVLVGSGSVEYGSQAYGAVVNLVMRRTGAATASAGSRASAVHARVGGPGHYGAGMVFSSAQNVFSWLVSGNLSDTDGREHRIADETGEAGVVGAFARAADFTVNGAYARGGSHRFLLNAYRFDHEALGVSLTFASGMGHDRLNRGLIASYGWSRALSPRARIEASLSYDAASRDFSRSRDDRIRTDVRGDRVAVGAASNVDLSESSRVRLGFDYDNRRSISWDSVDVRADRVLSRNNMRNRRLWEGSLFGQYEYRQDGFSAGAGVRLIKNENFGAHAAFAGDVGYRWGDSHRLQARAAQSYRSPTVFELFYETPDLTVFGNLDLQPETSDVFEFEYQTRVQDVTLRTVAFHARHDQQILRERRVPGSLTDRSTIYVNGPGLNSAGLEVEARYRIPDAAGGPAGLPETDVFVSYGFSDGDEDEATSPFRFAPDQTVAAGAARAIGPFVAAGLVKYRSSTDGPLSRIAGQGRLDLNFSYVHAYGSAELTHAISLSDLTNSEVWFPEYVRQNINRIPSGFGRSVSYVLRARFQ